MWHWLSPFALLLPLMVARAGPDAAVQRAAADLAQRLGVDVAEVRLVTREEVTWRDGSLGCPRPDVVYTQALVEGERLIFSVAGRRYYYHAGGHRDFFYCPHPDQSVLAPER